MTTSLIERALAGEDVSAAEIDRAAIYTEAARLQAEEAASVSHAQRLNLGGVNRIKAALSAK